MKEYIIRLSLQQKNISVLIPVLGKLSTDKSAGAPKKGSGISDAGHHNHQNTKNVFSSTLRRHTNTRDTTDNTQRKTE